VLQRGIVRERCSLRSPRFHREDRPDVPARRLSGLDAGFLYVESPETPMHVGSLTLYDPPRDLAGSFADRVRAHLAARMHLSPLLHQALAPMPLDLGHPVWIEAPEVDLDWHVVGLRVSRPGRMAELEALVAKLHAERLDRGRPLWRFHVIEGLADGRVAIYAQVHHAALDGNAGVRLAEALMDLGPEPRQVPRGTPRDPKRPGARRLLGDLLDNAIGQYATIVRHVPALARAAAGAVVEAGSQLPEIATLRERLLAPRTPFNAQIAAERVIRTHTLPLDQARTVASAAGATLNDVLLATVSGALRLYLRRRGALPVRSLVAAVPLPLREAGDARMSNQVTMLPATLATTARSPATRIAAIRAGMNELKAATGAFRGLIPTDFPSLGAPWLVGGLSKLLARSRLADRLPLPANLVVSNVPGPPVPLWLAGARMRAYYPLSIVIHGLALNITVHSYDGHLDFGLVACARAVPDLDRLAKDLDASFDELRAWAAARAAREGKAAPNRSHRPAQDARQARSKAATAVRSAAHATASRGAATMRRRRSGAP
jgi:WS/DGAT/MGAT family acyltransferase